jgi:hypothetical protein
MKTTTTLKTKTTEAAFSAALVVALLIILPLLGGTAMLIGSAVGLVAYIILFPERFRSRSGSLKPAVCVAAFFAVAAAAAVVFCLVRGHWY